MREEQGVRVSTERRAKQEMGLSEENDRKMKLNKVISKEGVCVWR